MKRSARPDVRSLAAASLAVTIAAVSGCSDDVVCPEPEPQPDVYLSAEITVSATSTPETSARVSAHADPLFSLLAAYVNGTRLPDVEADGLGLVATLEEESVLWEPGERCSLEVTTDYGFATSGLTLPASALAIAPDSVAPSETLRIVWNSAQGADYYRVSATFTAVSGSAFSRDELFSTTTRDTGYVTVVDSTAPTGVIAGRIEAVAGPFPQSGTEGNIGGDAWGFYTASYTDEGSAFSIEVTGSSR